ncbi:unnamed protein product [Citrullus colocynthis]|uniref:CRC domain-containing protein n=1 Tax=Citrullus colocynthis TaxID=252529 RepID=A0ABP0YW67_9ROSI
MEDFDYMDLINNLCHFDKLRIDYERALPPPPPSSMYPCGDHTQSNNKEAVTGDDHSKISYFHETENICAEIPVEKNDGVVYQNSDHVPYSNFASNNKNEYPNNDVRNNKQQMPSSVSVNDMNISRRIKRKREKEKVEGGNKPSLCCNCKKSECLKRYCECFASGVYCSKDHCSCIDCFNKPLYEDIVEAAKQQILSKNPSAFAPKKVKENKKTITSSSERRGCNCIIQCQRGYCPCFQAGVACTIACHCRSGYNFYRERPGNSNL